MEDHFAQILALTDPQIAGRLVDYRREMAESVENKADKLSELGIARYIESQKA